MTIKQLAQQAIDVQNASNLSGVVNGFASVVQHLKNAGVQHPRLHPVARLWASKIHDLCGMGLSDGKVYVKVYDACLALAGQEEVTA